MDLDFENLTAEETLFREAMESAGIPTTQDGLKEEFQTIVEASGIEITNTSPYSPFWNLITELVTKPVNWLQAFMVRYVMPNTYVKTAVSSYLDLIAWTYDLTRKPAAKTQGLLTFTRDSVAQPLSIPIGTKVRTIAINGTVYRMITTAAVAFPENVATVQVPAEAEESGAAYNLANGYYCILETDVPGVSGVTNAAGWLTSPGDTEETDTNLRLRIRNQFTAVTDWHTDAKYRAMISTQTGIHTDRIFFDHEIPRGPGSADAYILFDTYTPAQSYLDQINEYIDEEGNHGHGDDLVVKALPGTDHDVSVNIIFNTTLTEEVKVTRTAAIEQFIRCAFRQNSNYIGSVTQTSAFDRFSWSKLDQELHNYFIGVKSYHWGQDDIISNLDVPRLHNLTITRN